MLRLISTLSFAAVSLYAIGPQDLQLTAKPAQESFSLHEPVVINLTFTALEGAKLTPQFEAQGMLRMGGYRVLADPGGKSPPAGLYQSAEAGEQFAIYLYFSEDRTAEHAILLNKSVEFDQPGQYKVTIEFPDSRLAASVPVTITERDDARLQSVCQELGEAANASYPPLFTFKGSRFADPARQFAQQSLMYLREESLVPCLLQHATESNLAPMISLREMDSVTAAFALGVVMQSPQSKLSAEARRRVGELKDRTKKSEVRQAATSVLQ
jgi:hypothetical protein